MSKTFTSFDQALREARKEAARANREVCITRTRNHRRCDSWEISFIPSPRHIRQMRALMAEIERKEYWELKRAAEILASGTAWGMSLEEALGEVRGWGCPENERMVEHILINEAYYTRQADENGSDHPDG